ncbi:MAG TPA: hypothetical protein VHS99_22095 [Chloroflexota bacterium]|nr:hypothetical protein [Chloroflexota bacterium]
MLVYDLMADDELAASLGPAAQAIVGLYLANRREGEAFDTCLARLGAPKYAAMLREALQGIKAPRPYQGAPATHREQAAGRRREAAPAERSR